MNGKIAPPAPNSLRGREKAHPNKKPIGIYYTNQYINLLVIIHNKKTTKKRNASAHTLTKCLIILLRKWGFDLFFGRKMDKNACKYL